MLEVGLIDDYLDYLYYQVNEGFESTIFMSECDTLTKLFNYYVTDETLVKKERILLALNFSKIYDKCEITPMIYQLLYKKNGTFTGYLMESVPGKVLNEFCKDLSLPDMLILFKNFEAKLKLVHDNGFCLTDFNPGNMLVSENYTIKLVDIDSFCLMNDSPKYVFCNLRYACPYSKIFNRKSNIYSFYSLLIDMVFKVNRKDNKKREILKKITEEKLLPEDIKQKLVYFVNIRNKKNLLQLDYLF